MRTYFKDWGMLLNTNDFKRHKDQGNTAHEDHDGEGYMPKAQASIELDTHHAYGKVLLRLAL